MRRWPNQVPGWGRHKGSQGRDRTAAVEKARHAHWRVTARVHGPTPAHHPQASQGQGALDWQLPQSGMLALASPATEAAEDKGVEPACSNGDAPVAVAQLRGGKTEARAAGTTGRSERWSRPGGASCQFARTEAGCGPKWWSAEGPLGPTSQARPTHATQSGATPRGSQQTEPCAPCRRLPGDHTWPRRCTRGPETWDRRHDAGMAPRQLRSRGQQVQS